jgi:hypothetical protein
MASTLAPQNIPEEKAMDTHTAENPAPASEPNSEEIQPKEASEDTPQKVSRDVTGIRWFLVVLSILSSTFLWALDNTIVADVQPAIVRQFASVEKLPWLPVAFLLGASSTNLFWYNIS